MSNEMTAEEHKETCYIRNDYQKLMYDIQLRHYKYLVAKEAVAELQQQQDLFACGFAEWIVANDWRATVGSKNFAKWNPASSAWIYKTTAQLITEYKAWLESKKGE
jgi:hypothetical protein